MSGTVKIFFQDKGYGFLTDEKNIDHIFGVEDIIGAELPRNGDKVEYEPYQREKGLAARNIKIIAKAQDEVSWIHRTGIVECPHCHTLVYPRLITHDGRATRSLCNICGGTIREFPMDWTPFIGLFMLLAFIALIALAVGIYFILLK